MELVHMVTFAILLAGFAILATAYGADSRRMDENGMVEGGR